MYVKLISSKFKETLVSVTTTLIEVKYLLDTKFIQV